MGLGSGLSDSESEDGVDAMFCRDSESDSHYSGDGMLMFEDKEEDDEFVGCEDGPEWKQV